MNTASEHPPTPQHAYGTRIRHNIRIKPPVRGQDPHPQQRPPTSAAESHPIPNPFPPPHVVLHPEDAGSKTFLAIGRALMSVDNHAMTIKDLAEMTVLQGLQCQNVSAASQSITTYIRQHNERCDKQLDTPLLLKHVLSGTPDDDDLLPALYSRSGGAHSGIKTDNRITNFRRGAVVWYLSAATGAPCPFARAGIMLCEYGENGRGSEVSPEKKKQSSVDSGNKRKRSLRGNCIAADSDSDSSIEQLQPRQKEVKLSIRLPPLSALVPSSVTFALPAEDEEASSSASDADESDDSIAEQDAAGEVPWSLPPYPRRSISIPSSKPSIPDVYPETPFYRASSVARSIGSPPPDSDDDRDDYHISMTRRTSAGRRSAPKFDSDWDDWDADIDDSDGDGDTTWESPGPRSPLAHVPAKIEVKEEPEDLDTALGGWSDEVWTDLPMDGLDPADVKIEVQGMWDLSYDAHVKQEDDLDSLSLSSSFDNFRDPGPSSPQSPQNLHPAFAFGSARRLSDSFCRDSDTPELELDLDAAQFYSTLRPRSKTVPSLSSFFSETTGPTKTQAPMIVTQTLASLIQTMSMNSPTVTRDSFSFQPPCISPQETRCEGWSSDSVIVHTCTPCFPAISATQVEGISVYQMTLGTQIVLRRLDTDFVNLTSIVAHAKTPYPVLSTIPNATVITRGSASVRGTWVSISAAQAYVRDHPLSGNELDVFLSDDLASRFPSALASFSCDPSRGTAVFGRHFGSTLQATALCGGSQHKVPDVATFMTLSPLVPALPPADKPLEPEQPLTSTEQQIFRELCVTTEWDKDVVVVVDDVPLSPLSDVPDDIDAISKPEPGRRPRRSRRVAAVSATKGRTRKRR